MKVFLSVGATFSKEQESFVSAFELFLSQNGCERLTVGRGNYGAKQPILQARELMETADAVVVIAFTRSLIIDGIEKPGSPAKTPIKNEKYPTVWNQLEAAMAFGLKRPLMVIVEKGLHQEAMLKDRLEFRARITPLDPDFFKSDEFRGAFADFKQIAIERRQRRTSIPKVEAASLTVGDLLRDLRPAQLWKVGAAFLSLLAAVAAAAYWLGRNLQ